MSLRQVRIDRPPYLGRILVRWLGLAALSGSFAVTPVANAQAPVITNPGDPNYLNANEVFDPLAAPASAWTTKAPMPTYRDAFAIAAVNGRIYVAGGEVINNCTPIDTLEVYDPFTDTWTTKAPMPLPHPWFAGAGTVNGLIYIVGGEDGCGVAASTVQTYNPDTDTWGTAPDMPTARHSMGIAVIHDPILNRDILYAIGGAANTGNGINVPVKTVEAYDPAGSGGLGLWTTKAPMQQERFQPVVGVVNGKIYAIGGFDKNYTQGSDQTVEEYDPGNDTWNPNFKAPIPTARGIHPAGGVVNDIIYVVGGVDQTMPENTLSTVEAYDPSNGSNETWSPVASMPTARNDPGVAIVSNRLYAIGGAGGAIATVGQPFVYQLTATNQPTSYRATVYDQTAIALPDNLNFDPTTGIISGKPTAPFDSGLNQLQFFASNDASGEGPGQYLRITVKAAPSPGSVPQIVSSTCATGRTGEPFHFQVLTKNASPAARFTAGGLPYEEGVGPELTIDPVTGLISGMVSAPADGTPKNFPVTLTVNDGSTTTQATLVLTFVSDATPIINSSDSAILTPGQFFTYTMTADASASFSYIGSDGIKHEGPSPTTEGLPPGLSFDGVDTISGTPAPSGSGGGNTNVVASRNAAVQVASRSPTHPNTKTIRPPLFSRCQPIATQPSGSSGNVAGVRTSANTGSGATGTGTAPLNFFRVQYIAGRLAKCRRRCEWRL